MFGTSCNEQARENQIKNRGNPGEWFQHKADYRPPRLPPKLRYDGLGVAEKNKPTINQVINTYQADDMPPPAPIRLRNEAVNIADKFIHQEEKWFDYEGNKQFTPKKKSRACMTETAKKIADTNDQRRSHDWYQHRPDSADVNGKPPTGYVRCVSALARAIAKQMMESQIDECMSRDRVAIRQLSSSLPASPRVGKRTKSEGVKNALKNRGTADDWSKHHTVNDDKNLMITGTAAPYRCTSSEACGNYDRARGRDMARCFDYTKPSMDDRPPPRVQRDGLEYLEKSQKGFIGLAAEGRAMIRSHSSAPAIRMRPEGEKIAEKNASHMAEMFDQEKNRQYREPQPQPRLRNVEAEEAANRNKGQMQTIIGNTTDYRPSAAPPKKNQIRSVSNNAKEFYERGQGSSMKELVENYRLPPEPQPKPRVTAWAEDIADRDHNSHELSQLFSKYGNLPPNEQPAMRIRPEMQHIALKHTQDHVFDVFNHRD